MKTKTKKPAWISRNEVGAVLILSIPTMRKLETIGALPTALKINGMNGWQYDLGALIVLIRAAHRPDKHMPDLPFNPANILAGDAIMAKEAAEVLQISYSGLCKWVAYGEIPHYLFGGRSKFDPQELREWAVRAEKANRFAFGLESRGRYEKWLKG